MTSNLGRLNALPRRRLGHAPTAIEAMPNLERQVGGSRLFVKRDDCTGLALGGNKVRQLEFYFGEAAARDADTVLITGAVQSNFARLAAAAARTSGMECHIQLEERVPNTDPVYRSSGNVLLERLMGATLHSYPAGEDEEGADRRLGEIAAELESRGRRPYIIPLAPGHRPLGALGYVVAARETLVQLAERDLALDEVVLPSGSGNTHAGFLFGLRALGCRVPVTGICVRRDAVAQRERIVTRCREIADLLEMDSVVDQADVVVSDTFLAPGYGRLNEATLQAIAMGAQCEALILDPVYSGKTMAGAIDRAHDIGAGRTILFLHTGGAPAVFAYQNALSEAFA